MGKIAVLSLLLALSACQTANKGSFCAIATPQRPSLTTIDQLTDAEVTALLAHNKRGGKLCGWRP